jgi:4-hydroxybenzoate polyprenyltransferase
MSRQSHIQLFIDALRLSRVNNLMIIFLTQYLGAIFLTAYHYSIILTDLQFFALVISTLLIAAAGYYINDYYDIKIDLINKPNKVIVGKAIKRRPVMIAHTFLNGMGILIGAWVSLWIGLINILVAILLWWYSNQLKRWPLAGNVLVAFMTSATLLLLMVYFNTTDVLIFTYAFFAFGITLLREIIKDIEDIEGDASHDGHTLPVILGIRKTKSVLFVIIVLFFTCLSYFLVRIHNVYLSVYFGLLFIPFIHFVYLLVNADTKNHFSQLSTYCKWIIIAGIFSMVLIKL